MFQKYPNWKMVVYPTRRSASFPQRTYDMTIKNASTGELVDDGKAVWSRTASGEVELRLLSGEVFVLGEVSVTRVA